LYKSHLDKILVPTCPPPQRDRCHVRSGKDRTRAGDSLEKNESKNTKKISDNFSFFRVTVTPNKPSVKVKKTRRIFP
jgi:hypothetical protein